MLALFSMGAQKLRRTTMGRACDAGNASLPAAVSLVMCIYIYEHAYRLGSNKSIIFKCFPPLQLLPRIKMLPSSPYENFYARVCSWCCEYSECSEYSYTLRTLITAYEILVAFICGSIVAVGYSMLAKLSISF